MNFINELNGLSLAVKLAIIENVISTNVHYDYEYELALMIRDSKQKTAEMPLEMKYKL